MGSTPQKPGTKSQRIATPLPPHSHDEPSADVGSPPLRRRLAGSRVTLCVTGSIAAYKAVLLLRLLLKEGADVEVVLTESAQQFVGAATFAGLTGKPVHGGMFGAQVTGEPHLEL